MASLVSLGADATAPAGTSCGDTRTKKAAPTTPRQTVRRFAHPGPAIPHGAGRRTPTGPRAQSVRRMPRAVRARMDRCDRNVAIALALSVPAGKRMR